MKYRRYTEQEVVEKTRYAIRLFICKEMEPFVSLLDEDFVWVGDYEPLYMRGIPAFLESIQDEMQSVPVKISEEEYALLSHEQRLWITYGRFTASSFGMSVRIHFTLVWRQKDNKLLLIHANANHAGKSPNDTTQSKIFETPPQKGLRPYGENTRTLTIRDLSGSIHYLLSDEIKFVKANNKICEFFTDNGFFPSRITLRELVRPPFFRIHKSYLVNPAHLREICRYRATLLDGTQIPIGKEWYMALKEYLKADTAKTM